VSGGRGFWRRNLWGFLAVAPLLAAMVAVHPEHPWELWAREPRSRVVADAEGWVTFGGARLRVVALPPFKPFDRGGAPLPLPPEVRAWRVTIEIGDLADPEALLGCEWLLVDDQGRSFHDRPSEFVTASVPYASNCSLEDAVEGKVAAHFLLPASARPVGVRLEASGLLPQYAWFDVPS